MDAYAIPYDELELHHGLGPCQNGNVFGHSPPQKCFSFSGKAAFPRITPDGYNANLNESKVELRCLLPSGTRIVLWFINTVSIFQTEDQNLRERGICINTGSRVAGYSTYVPIFIEPKAENDKNARA